MRTRLFQFALVLTVAAGLLRGQETTAPTPAAPAPAVSPAAPAPEPAPAAEPAAVTPAPAPAPAAEAGPGVSRSRDTLSVDFPDEDIRTILRNVADLFELNLVVPDTLQGKTSIKLHDVTWRQVFEVVLTPVGYTYIEQGGIIKVVSLEALNLEPMTTEVFTLNYANAAEVQGSIAPRIDAAAGGKLGVDKRTNSLIITERPSRLKVIRPLIERLDKATAQVMIESKFVEVTNSDVKNLGLNWGSLSGYGISAGPFTSSTTVTDGHSNNNTHSNANTDVPFMYSGYEAADAVATRNNPGIDPSDPLHGIGPKFTVDATSGATSYTDIGPASSLSQALTNVFKRENTAVFDAAQFKVVLSALQTNNATKVVSNPTIVTLNNTEAFINVGEEYPIPNYTYNQERGNFEVSGFVYKPIGIILKVTPQVNAGGFIRLAIEPTVSQRNGTANFGGSGGAEIPIIAERTARTQVTMKDGFTMAIGGLLKTQVINGGSKIPVLGSIPVLGRLFRSDSKDKQSSNLIIFITAKTINAEGARVEETISPEQIRGLEMRREDLPGYRGGSDPFLPSTSTEGSEPKSAE